MYNDEAERWAVPNLALFGKSRLSRGVKKSSLVRCTAETAQTPWGFSRDLYKSHCHRGHHLSLSLAGKSWERQTGYTKRCLHLWSYRWFFLKKEKKSLAKKTSENLKSFNSQAVSVESQWFWIFSVQKSVPHPTKVKTAVWNSEFSRTSNFRMWFCSFLRKSHL